MEYKYIVNNNNRIIIRDELILSNQQILQAINFCNQALQKLDQETKQFDINIFEILGMRNLSGMVGEYFAKSVQRFSEGHLQLTTPVQALKFCARFLRHRSQNLPFLLVITSRNAGYRSYFVSTSTYNRICLIVLLFLYF